MQLDRINTGRTVEGNMPSLKKSPLRISPEARDHLMETLSNLYSDPAMAVIREYYCNGYDSHKQAGVTRPVEITLPTPYSPSFIVRDYGLGMSAQFIDDVFLEYGHSTKNKNNEVIGALGYGGKSGFAVSDQFTVTSYHDGKKITVLFEKTPEGYESNIVSIVDTEEGNGVIVTIPVKKEFMEVFAERAHEFFYYTDPGTVLVDGRVPQSLWENTDWTNTAIENEEFTILFKLRKEWNHTRELRLIMGGVPYVVPSSEIHDAMARVNKATGLRVSLHNSTLYVKVPMASFDLNYSREGVRATAKTKDLLDRVLTLFCTQLVKRSEDIIGSAKNYLDVFPLVEGISAYIDTQNIMWNGLPVINAITAPSICIAGKSTNSLMYKSISSTLPLKFASSLISQKNNLIILVGRSVTDFHDKDSKRLSGYIVGAGIDSVVFYAVGDSLEEAFSEDDIKYIRAIPEYTVLDYSEFLKTVRRGEKIRRETNKAKKALEGPKAAKEKKEVRFPVLDIIKSEVEWVLASEVSDDSVYLWSQHMSVPYDPTHGARRAVTSYVSETENYSRYPVHTLSRHLRVVLTDVTHVVLLAGHRNPVYMRKHTGKDLQNIVDITAALAEKSLQDMDERSAALSIIYEDSYISALRQALTPQSIENIKDPDLKSVLSSDKKIVADLTPLISNTLSYLQFEKIPSWDYRAKVERKQRECAKKSASFGFDFSAQYPLITWINPARFNTSTSKAAAEDIIEYFNTRYEQIKASTPVSITV